MNAWEQATAEGVDIRTCIRCKITYGISEFVSLNGKKLCKMCGACRKIHRENDREYKRKRREKQLEEDRMKSRQIHANSHPSSSRARPIPQYTPTPTPVPVPQVPIPQANPVQRQMPFHYSMSLPPQMPMHMPQYMPVPNHMSMHPWNYVMESSYPSHYGGTPEYNAPPSLPGSCSLPYFICLHCGIPRSTKLIYESVCVYCLGYEQKYCMYGDHEEERRNFYDGTGVEQVRCNNCRDDDEEDEQLPEAKKETAPESSDDSDDNDTDLSDTSSAVIQLNAPVNTRKVPQGVQTVQGLNKTDAIFIDAPVNAQKEPRGVQGHDKPDIILVDAPGEVQKDPQEVVQMNTQTDDIPKEAQHDAQGIAQENQPDMVLVDVQGDDILLSDVPGDVQESIKSDTPADTQVKIQGNPQVDAQGDTANFKTGEEEIPHKRSPEPAESVKIKKENDDSVQFESLNRIPVAPIGGDIASDPILID